MNPVRIACSLLVLVLLAGCTPGARYGVRLNDDSTIDFVTCDRSVTDVTVDYWSLSEPEGDPEWIAERTELPSSRVVRYGDDAYVSTVLREPPDDWTEVAFNWGYAHRDDLTVGVWSWHTEPLPFVPDRPCSTVNAEELSR